MAGETDCGKEKHLVAIMEWCWKVVKRRIQPGHVLWEEGDIYCHLASKYIPTESKLDSPYNRIENFSCGVGKCTQVFQNLAKYESHYNSIHRNECQTCRRIFPSAHLLEVHVLENHDTMFALLAAKQPMYHCLLEDCELRFKDAKVRRNHMIKQHKYPANFRYDRHKPNNRTGKTADSAVAKRDRNSDITEDITDQGWNDSVNGTVAMEMGVTDTLPEKQPSGRVFSYKVPKNICFGHGVQQGFLGSRGRGRGRKQGKKHWHNVNSSNMDTSVNIEEVKMTDLSDALS